MGRMELLRGYFLLGAHEHVCSDVGHLEPLCEDEDGLGDVDHVGDVLGEKLGRGGQGEVPRAG